MNIRTSYGLRTALIAVAAIGWYTGANAQLTPANTQILNRATVNYSVGGQPQTEIESSPTGNTTPGAGLGTDTAFVVDNRVDLTVSEEGGTATMTSPGATNAVLAYRVTNTGNSPQGYALSMLEEAGTGPLFGNTDNVDFGNLIVRVDDGSGSYDAADTATFINVLNPTQSVLVFIVSPTVPPGQNLDVANVRLTAATALPNTNGGTPQLESGPAVVNNPATVEVLFADAGRDATESAVDQYFVQSASLTISKVPTVLSDTFGSASPRAIPGATVEYVITIANTSATTGADAVEVSDAVPPFTTFLPGVYGTEDVRVANGAVVTTCTADAADADNDGCGITAGLLSVEPSEIGSIAAGATAEVRFQVTIN